MAESKPPPSNRSKPEQKVPQFVAQQLHRVRPNPPSAIKKSSKPQQAHTSTNAKNAKVDNVRVAKSKGKASTTSSRHRREPHPLAVELADALVKYRAGVFAIASNALDDAEAGLLTRLRDGKAEPTPDGEARMDNYIEAEPSHQSAEATFEALVAHQKNLRRPIGDEMLIIRPKSNGKGPSSAATSETYEISLSDSFASFDQLVKTTQATLTSLKMGWEDVCQEISTLSEDILGDDRQKQDKSANESDVEKKQLLKDVKGLVDDLVKDMMAKVEAEEKTTIKGQKKMKETLLASLENMEI